jgi:hypothetical protein
VISVRAGFAVTMLAIPFALPSMTIAGGQAGSLTNAVTPAEAQAGWRVLFDGKTLDGWRTIGDLKWSIVDGAIVGDAASQPAAKPVPPRTWASGFLRSVESFDDFEMSVDFWSEADTNSGLFIRVASPMTAPNLAGGYEINIGDTHETFPTGSIVNVRSTLPRRAESAGKWSRLQVRADGPRMVVTVNGETLTDVRDEKLKSGSVGFQAGGPTGSGIIKLRNIRIRPLK